MRGGFKRACPPSSLALVVFKESNPVELVWWSLHEAVSRNHECAGLDELVEFAECYLEERQPFRLKLGKVYDHLERPPP
jgi:hypothetical protein